MWQEPDVVRDDLGRIGAAGWVPWHALQDRTVLVTGATGLIGRTLTKALLWHAMQHDSGTRVLALVRDEARARRTFAPALDAGAPLSFLQGDVQALEDTGGPVHLVVHGASVTASREMVTNPVGTIATALRGTERVLELAREAQVASVVYLSSVEAYGAPHGRRRIAESDLLDSGRVRVVYRPHPKTGERNPAFLARHLELVRLLEQAGPPHAVDRPHTSDLLDRFNEAHLLVADRSGVLSDFLASDKPYCVVNATGAGEEEFRAAHPSTAGAYLLGSGASGLSAALDDALGPDTLRGRRRDTRTAVIGPATDDALAPFLAAVDALAGAGARSRPTGTGPTSPG